MERIRLHATAIAIGWLGFVAARTAGLPIWFDWPSFENPADATDVGALCWFIALNILARKEPTQ